MKRRRRSRRRREGRREEGRRGEERRGEGGGKKKIINTKSGFQYLSLVTHLVL